MSDRLRLPIEWEIGTGTRYSLSVFPYPHGEIGFDLINHEIYDEDIALDDDERPVAGIVCSNLTIEAAEEVVERLNRAIAKAKGADSASVR